MARVLYITRNGLLEPLGQSQVFAYLKGLARDHHIIILSREKAEDWADTAAMDALRAKCSALGIDWRPKPFRFRPRLIAPAADLAGMIWEALRLARSKQIDFLHARSYIPAAVAWAVWKRSGVPFIFDMRALWPEELIAAGRLQSGSRIDRAIRGVERRCLRDSVAVVSLTNAAVDHLRDQYPAELGNRTVDVIPTCADLDRFTLEDDRPRSGPRIHGCAGTIISGWFRTDLLAAWFAAVAEESPTDRFEILTRDPADVVRRLIDPLGVLGDRLTIASRKPAEMPEALRRHDLSAMFFTTGLSKLGSAPTRMGEVLGTGMPVIANAGVGDMAQIVNEHRVGVLVDRPDPADMAAAYRAAEHLLADPELPARCRAAAEAIFSLEGGTERYRRIYGRIKRSEG